MLHADTRDDRDFRQKTLIKMRYKHLRTQYSNSHVDDQSHRYIHDHPLI